MFTGIVEATGFIESITNEGTNSTFWISSPLSDEFKIDQSISHNGVCLTVDAVDPGRHRVTAVSETLEKSNLGKLRTGEVVNLERSMMMNGRLDGHIVQGHVDTTGTCESARDLDGSWEYRFKFDDQFGALIIEKGSICLNGISLTIFDTTNNGFSVAIIPYTYNFTNMKFLKAGDPVNLEFDMVGKYINRIHSLAGNKTLQTFGQ